MNIKPLADRVLVKVTQAEKKTSGGLYIPDTANQEKTQVAVVIAIGDDTEAIKVKPGDTVMYDKYAGTALKVEGADHLILAAKEIIAIIN